MPSPKKPALIALLTLLCTLAPKYSVPAQTRPKDRAIWTSG
jgi:hypothetical protein